MKKILALMLIMLVWLPLTAFSSVSSGAMFSSSSVYEIITFTYSETDAEKLSCSEDELKVTLSLIAQDVKNHISQIMNQKIDNDSELTFDEKQSLKESITIGPDNTSQTDGKMYFIITYPNKTAWQYMASNAVEATTSTVEKSLFTTTYKKVIPIQLSSFDIQGEEKNIFDFVVDEVMKDMKNLFPSVSTQTIEELLPATLNYSYITSIKRLHSNADVIEKDLSGYYYHTWQFEKGDAPEITIWQTVANPVVWYCLALVLTGVLVIVLLIVSKKKKVTKKNNEIVIEE